MRTVEVTICIIFSETAQSPTTVTAALPYSRSCGRVTRAVPGPRRCPHPPHRRHPGQRGLMACQPFPRQQNLAAESISPTTGPGKEGNKRCYGAVWYASGCDMTGGAGPAQPTYHHPTITSHQSITFAVPNVTSLHWADGLPYSLQLWETGP